MTMPNLRCGVIGLGVGEQHALAFRNAPNADLVLLHDLDKQRAQDVVQRLGCGHVADNEDALLNTDDLDVVAIASFDDDHADQVVKGLRKGKHLFVEKPLCRTRDELQRIRQAWLAANKPALDSNLVLRSAPLYRRLRTMIAAGEFGDIYAIDGEYLYGRLHKITKGWRHGVADYSVILGGAIHMLDLLCWLTGQYPSTVSATGNRICTTGTSFQYDDFRTGVLTFPSGMIGRITANFGCVHRHQHVLRIFGTKATFILDDQGPRLFLSRDPDTPAASLPDSPLPAAKGDLIPGFLDLIGRPPDIDAVAQHNFKIITACITVDEAARHDEKLEVNYV